MASTKMMTVFTTEQTEAMVGVLMLTSKLAFVVIAFTRSGLLRSKDFPGIIRNGRKVAVCTVAELPLLVGRSGP